MSLGKQSDLVRVTVTQWVGQEFMTLPSVRTTVLRCPERLYVTPAHISFLVIAVKECIL